MIWASEIPYFGRTELACKCGCGKLELDIRFAAALPALRLAWGGSLGLTSCCRCKPHNDKIGGHPRSLHLIDNPAHPCDGTMAADVAWRTWPTQTKLRFARLAFSHGWSVGLHNGFCHIDRRKDMNQAQAVFLYGKDWDEATFAVTDVHTQE